MGGPQHAENLLMNHPDIKFREYEPGDIPACGRLAKEAWPVGPGIASSEESELSGMEGYMEYSLSVSNWSEVAYDSEGIIGFLFGRIDGLPGRVVVRRSPLGELASIARSILDDERNNLANIRFLWSLALTEFKLKVKMPKSDAHIEMFIVASRHRGKGVGSALFERFITAAKKAGSSLVTVYTDDQISNWNYYERRGFKRVGTFYDNITSHYSGTDAYGIIFELRM